MLKRVLEDAPLWIAFLILIIAVIFLIYGYSLIELPTSYWLFILYGTETPALALIYLPLILIVLMVWITVVPQEERKKIYVTVGGMMLLANILMLASILPMAFGNYRHHDSAWFNGHTYYVGSAWKPGIGGTYPSVLLLYECDGVGLFCEVIHSQDMSGIPLRGHLNIRLRDA